MPPTTIRRSSHLPASPDDVWAAIKRPVTFRLVTRPLFAMPALRRFGDDIARPGLEGRGWILLFGFLPIERRTIRVVVVDEDARRLETSEHAGVIRSWRHVLQAEPHRAGCRYTDEVTFDAGALTGLLRPVISAIFRYRHHRWRTDLAAILTAA